MEEQFKKYAKDTYNMVGCLVFTIYIVIFSSILIWFFS